MTAIIGPRGWRQDQVLHRLDSSTALTPLSYDAKTRCVDAILSVGSPVKRVYGVEKLRIAPECVDLNRVRNGSAPLLDSHQGTSIKNVLGRIQRAWFDKGALMGRLLFADTADGRIAEGMVARGEIAATSLGYRVESWEITDADNNILDPDKNHISWDDDLTFTATRFEVLETSLVSIPADAQALIRQLATGHGLDDIRARMESRQRMAGIDDNADIRARMLTRQRMHDLQQTSFDDDRLN
jgi:hypothetical protein